jgi:tRNA1(Val) A37 N6-methylase TrmN6
MSDLARPIAAVTADAFLGGSLVLEQPRQGYRAGLDPVLLAATCTARAGECVADLGAGVGTIGLCVARRITDVAVKLIEREATYVKLALRNVAANGLAGRVTVVAADLTQSLGRTPALASLAGRCDHVLANPPYFAAGRGTPAADGLRAAAQAMPARDVEHWMRTAAALLRADGRLHVIQRVEALPTLLGALEGRFGAIAIHPVQSTATAGATRVILTAIRGSRAPLRFGPALIVHGSEGGFSPRIEAVLRHAAPLEL